MGSGITDIGRAGMIARTHDRHTGGSALAGRAGRYGEIARDLAGREGAGDPI